MKSLFLVFLFLVINKGAGHLTFILKNKSAQAECSGRPVRFWRWQRRWQRFHGRRFGNDRWRKLDPFKRTPGEGGCTPNAPTTRYFETIWTLHSIATFPAQNRTYSWTLGGKLYFVGICISVFDREEGQEEFAPRRKRRRFGQRPRDEEETNKKRIVLPS